MGDPSLMMLGGQHHGGILTAKEERDESDLASYTTSPISTHDLMSNSAIGLSLNGEGDDEEDLDHSAFSASDGFHDLNYDGGKGVPQEAHHEPAIPRLMQMQMEKYHYIYMFVLVCELLMVVRDDHGIVGEEA